MAFFSPKNPKHTKAIRQKKSARHRKGTSVSEVTRPHQRLNGLDFLGLLCSLRWSSNRLTLRRCRRSCCRCRLMTSKRVTSSPKMSRAGPVINLPPPPTPLRPGHHQQPLIHSENDVNDGPDILPPSPFSGKSERKSRPKEKYQQNSIHSLQLLSCRKD